jgi:hypothetical protein
MHHGDLKNEVRRLELFWGNALGDAAAATDAEQQSVAQAIADAAEQELEAAEAVLASRSGR